MPRTTIGQRLKKAMNALGIHQAELARRADVSTATMANWLNDKVETEHVKAAALFQIANAAGLTGHELLYDTPERTPPGHVGEDPAVYTSQPLQLDNLKIALQLVAEALDDRGLTLPPEKRAEVTLLAYELLLEEMPRARVLRFVQAAAA